MILKRNIRSIVKRQIRVLTFILTFIILFSGKEKSVATLEIQIKDCRSNILEYLGELTILKNNKIIEHLNPQHNSKQTLTNLDTGTYFLEYKSIFGKIERLKVLIPEFKTYTVDLCINYLDHSKEIYKPIIDQLRNKENYKILMYSHGCFHATADSLTIFRKNDRFFTTFGNKTKELTPDDIIAIQHFEIELNYMGEGGCTTTDTYIILYKKQKKVIHDGSCSWNGDYFLMKELWNKE